MYNNDETTKRATSLKHNKSMPREWWAAWQKVQKDQIRTHKENGQAAAAEVAVKMGCAYPIWAGVVTNAWIWLLGWGDIIDTQIVKFTRKIRRILIDHAQKWWKTRIKLIDEIKTERNKKICTTTGNIKISREAVKLGLWNLGANVTNIQGGRGKRKWTHKIKEPNKKKHYNQNTLTEIPGFERKIQEKTAQPKTVENIKQELLRDNHKRQSNITNWTEKITQKRKLTEPGPEKITQTKKKQLKIQDKIKQDKLEQQCRNAMTQWIKKGKTPTRNEDTPRDNAVEPTLDRTTRDLIQRMQGTVIPVHGDGACWYRAMAKACNTEPMHFIKCMEEGIVAHINRRNRTDGNFVTSINELDETRAQRKLDHYTNMKYH